MRPPHSLIAAFLVFLAMSPAIAVADSETIIDHRGDELVLDASRNQEITGTTPFERGTVIGVRVKSTGDTHPFLVSKAVRVDENGSFGVSFDLSGLAPLHGGPVTVVLRHNETTFHEIDGVLVTRNMPENSTLTYDPSTPDLTTTQTPTPTTTQTTTGPFSGVTVPGFGITTAVLALLSVGLVARL